MDIENLKLVISILNELGSNTKESFIWWLVLTNGSTYLFGFIWSGIALYIIKLGYRLIISYMDAEKIMTSAGINSYFTPNELKKVCKTLELHYKDTQL